MTVDGPHWMWVIITVFNLLSFAATVWSICRQETTARTDFGRFAGRFISLVAGTIIAAECYFLARALGWI